MEVTVDEVMLVVDIMLGIVAVGAVAIGSAAQNSPCFRNCGSFAAHGADAWAIEELRNGRL
jgi:hypothetical protein